jgi:cytochrome c oxidase subunit 2
MSLNDLFGRLLGLPELASKHGADVDKLIIYVHYLMLVLFAGWTAYFLFCLFWFRKGRHPRADYHGFRGHASTWLEIAVAAIEAVLLLGFAVPLWAKVVEEFPDDKDSTVIRVTAQQFAWNARYPGKDGVFGRQDVSLLGADNKFGYVKSDPAYADDVTPPVNEIAVPVGKPVVIKLTSMDVIHSFKLYNFRVNQDAIPGLMVPVHFTPTQVGRFQVVCAQLCGNSHSAMRGLFTVMKPEEYEAWLASKPKAGATGSASFE